MNLVKSFLTASVFALVGSAANAAVVHIEDFGSGSPGQVPDPYINEGYSWTPVNPDNSAHCFDALCLHEAGMQEILSRTDTDPDTTEAFDLLGFFVDLTGQGNDDGNFLTVTGKFEEEENKGDVFMTLLIDNTNFAEFSGGGDYADIFDRDGEPVSEIIPHGGSANGVFVMIYDGFFYGVTSISWNALGSANVRLDCVALSRPTGEGSVSLVEMTSCNPNPSVIPLPAAGWLLFAGLGSLAVMRRRPI
jgi:hypothetical protein